MSDPITDDVKKFGRDKWVYCRQHLRPHTTGWCTVNVDQKELLAAESQKAAYEECEQRGFKIYDAQGLSIR